MRLRAVWVGIAAAAAIGLALVFNSYLPRFRDAILPGLGSSRTTSTTLVDVVLHDLDRRAELRLTIPQAYMVRGGDQRGGTLDGLRIETRLPDLAPAPALPQVEGSPPTARSLEAFNNGVALYLSNDFIEPNWAAGTPRTFWLDRFSADRSSGGAVVFELVEEDHSGLWFYRELSCDSADDPRRATEPAQARECRDTYREHYLSRSPESPTVKIDCDVQLLATLTYRLGCTAATSYHGFQLTYVFRHSQLNRWSEFDTGVRQLLDRFVANALARAREALGLPVPEVRRARCVARTVSLDSSMPAELAPQRGAQASAPVFKALVEVGDQQLWANGLALPLAAGMQVSAEIKQDKRTVLEYLLSPVQRVASEARSEI